MPERDLFIARVASTVVGVGIFDAAVRRDWLLLALMFLIAAVGDKIGARASTKRTGGG